MAEHFGALEADFAREYQVDLRRLLWVDGVGCRRLWELMAGLSESSAFRGELRAKPAPESKPEPGGWRSLARRMTGR